MKLEYPYKVKSLIQTNGLIVQSIRASKRIPVVGAASKTI